MPNEKFDLILSQLYEMRNNLEHRIRWDANRPSWEPSLMSVPTDDEKMLLERVKEIRNPKFVGPLVEILTLLPTNKVTYIAMIEKALIALGEAAVPALQNLIKSEHCFKVVPILASIGNPASLKPILEKATEQKGLLLDAIHICKKVGGEEALIFLMAVLQTYQPLRFPASISRRSEKDARLFVTDQAIEALKTITGQNYSKNNDWIEWWKDHLTEKKD
jgi:hypothetical protein